MLSNFQSFIIKPCYVERKEERRWKLNVSDENGNSYTLVEETELLYSIRHNEKRRTHHDKTGI